MHDFRYIPKGEYQPFKNELINLITEVQDEVRNFFTFQYYFIGSTKRNMITRDYKSNIGFDFDVNITINDDDEEYSPYEIRSILKKAITKVSRNYGFTKCEDSTRVITIKKANRWYSTIEHSCDFAVVYGSQYIRYNKGSQKYSWESQSKGYINIEQRADTLKNDKNKKYWNEVRKVYIDKKNCNTNPDKHSRSIYAETINEVYKRYMNDKNN
ncbi:MAG: hypothetical protein SO152_05785 [Ruminococcus sp.]|nr:hypothetical protein [Ruminococcus sp.]